MPIHEAPRAWVTIPEAAKALGMNKQTIRNRAVAGEIPGAIRETGGQKQWRIPGDWFGDEVAEMVGDDEAPRGVRIDRLRKIRGSDPPRYKTIETMIWRNAKLVAADMADSGAPEVVR